MPPIVGDNHKWTMTIKMYDHLMLTTTTIICCKPHKSNEAPSLKLQQQKEEKITHDIAKYSNCRLATRNIKPYEFNFFLYFDNKLALMAIKRH